MIFTDLLLLILTNGLVVEVISIFNTYELLYLYLEYCLLNKDILNLGFCCADLYASQGWVLSEVVAKCSFFRENTKRK